MYNDEFGGRTYSESSPGATGGNYSAGQGSDPYGYSSSVNYDYDPNRKARMEMEQLERERTQMTSRYSRPPKARGEVVAKVAGALGIASLVIGLIFLAGWGVDYTVIRVGFLLLLGCLMVPLGALLSVAAVILAVISLILGAGGSRSKAIFAIIFSVMFWMMIGAWYFVANYYFGS